MTDRDQYFKEIQQAANELAQKKTLAQQQAPDPPGLSIIDIADLEGNESPRREWLVKGVLPRKSVVLLSGKGGIGKSYVVLQLAECRRRGEPFLGRETIAGTTLVYSCEDDRDELHRRHFGLLRSLGRSHSPAGRLLLAPRVGEGNALMAFDARTGISGPTDAFRALEEAAAANEVDLISIDTVAQTFPGSENDRAQVTAFVNQCAGLALRINGCVLLLAHPPKNEAEYSGSTGWDGTVRARLLLRAEDDDGIRRYFLKLAKANYAPEFEDELVRDENGVLYLADKAPPSMADKIAAYQDLAQYKRIFLSALDILTRQGRAVSHSNRAPNFAPKVIIRAELGLGCSSKQLTAAMEALFKDGTITAGVVVGKGSDRKPIYGIARTVPKEPANHGSSEDERDEATDPNVIDLNNFRSPSP